MITSAKYRDIFREFVSIQNTLESGKHSSSFMQDNSREQSLDFLNEHFNDHVIALDYEKHRHSGMVALSIR